MAKLLVLSAVASTALGQFGSIPQPVPGQMVAMDSCAHVVDCFGTYPLKPGHTRDEFPGTNPSPPRIVPGYVVPNYTIGPGDSNCPSGNCIPIDPNNICDGYAPDCLPGPNVRLPLLKCDPKHPRCPPNGFLVIPHISCHPAGKTCPPGGVITTPGFCKPGEHCPCGCGTYLPPWVTSCRAGEPNCPNGQHVTDPPIWPVYPPGEPHIPGWPWDPSKTCDPSLGGHCDGDDIVVPNGPKDECDARKPGCIPQTSIPPTAPPSDPRDPACPNGQCVLVPPQGCHPNDPHPAPNCIPINPIPCTAGTEGCPGGVEVPDVVNPCKPGTPGCPPNGFITPDRPIVKPNDPVIPKENPRLELDPNGQQRCSFVETPQLPNGKIDPEECKNREEDLKPRFYGDSKFPCTKDDKKPALGPELQGWLRFKSNGSDLPSKHARFEDKIKFSEDSILQVAQWTFNKRWGVRIDGKDLGTTDLGTMDLDRKCGSDDTDVCVERGCPNGYFFIPAGYHQMEFILQDGKKGPLEWHRGDYRFLHVAKCHPEKSGADDSPSAEGTSMVSPDPPSFGPPKEETVTVQTPPQSTTDTNAPGYQPPEPPRTQTMSMEPPSQQVVNPPPQADPPRQDNGARNPPPPPPPEPSTASVPPPQEQVEQPTSSAQPTPSEQPIPSAQPKAPGYKDFPCTEDASWPCRGTELEKWNNMWFKWNSQYRRPGPPAPWVKEINYSDDTIFTLTDVENYVEHFEVFLDGKSIGETEEGPQHPFPDRWRRKCGHGEPERCMKDGWSHGFFRIPSGPHTLSISWTKGDFNNWVYATGMYRFDALCTKC
ncbi:Hypothetical predicted protein [Lecanosticta acicola]|uniref:Uncharacterized protein n=1 Tax=Lecanosticta acicola TaxID=111012 RepID=A0AAI9EBF5_9PEZI|nr:Hypothetical predicted protein [Lecanosticta acicola]